MSFFFFFVTFPTFLMGVYPGTFLPFWPHPGGNQLPVWSSLVLQCAQQAPDPVQTAAPI